MNNFNQLGVSCGIDFHLHLREDERTEIVMGFSMEKLSACTPMPNVTFPKTGKKIMSTEGVIWYKNYLEEQASNLDLSGSCEFLMTFYVGADTDVEDIRAGYHAGHFKAGKMYPLGATTGSNDGLADLKDQYDLFKMMAEEGIPLLIHGEMPAGDDDVFKSEKIFIKKRLKPLRKKFPTLKIVLEHITTRQALDFVMKNDNTWATITPQHLLNNRNDLFRGDRRHFLFCWPLPKSKKHQMYLQNGLEKAILSGKLAMGTDSAPHMTVDKMSACGCAGVFSAPVMWEVYYQAISISLENPTHERVIALLQKFTHNLVSVYDIDINALPQKEIYFEKEEWIVPLDISGISPYRAGTKLQIKAYVR